MNNHIIENVVSKLEVYIHQEDLTRSFTSFLLTTYAEEVVKSSYYQNSNSLSMINHINTVDSILKQFASNWRSIQWKMSLKLPDPSKKQPEINRLSKKYSNTNYIRDIEQQLIKYLQVASIAQVEADKHKVYDYYSSQYQTLDDDILEQIIMTVYGGFFNTDKAKLNARLILGFIKQLKASLINQYSAAPYALIFYGPNRIGKSQFIESLRKALAVVPTYNNLSTKLELDSFTRTPSWGTSVLLYANELGYESKADERKLKELITYETIKFSPFYLNEQHDIRSISNVILSSNFDPSSILFVGVERRRGTVYMTDSTLLTTEQLQQAGYHSYNCYIDDFVSFLMHSTAIKNVNDYANITCDLILKDQQSAEQFSYLSSYLTPTILEKFLTDWMDRKRLQYSHLIHHLKSEGYFKLENPKQMQKRLKLDLTNMQLVDSDWKVRKKKVQELIAHKTAQPEIPREEDIYTENQVVRFPYQAKYAHLNTITPEIIQACQEISNGPE